MPNDRLTALQTLLRVESRGGYSNIALAQSLRGMDSDARSRAFCSALVYGVLERGVTIDRILAPRVSRPLEKLDPPVLCILRMGVYQMYYMDGVPDAAAVDESVKLCRAARKTSAGGLVNGVLRGLAREGKPLPPAKDEMDRMSLDYAAPRDLAEHLIGAYGRETAEAFLRNALYPAPVFARVNLVRTDTGGLLRALREEGAAASACPGCPGAVRLEAPGSLEALRAWRDGLFHVQDLSSQRCALALDAQPGMEVLDACAAPGGKAFTAAQEMRGIGRVTACDVHPHKLELIRQGARRLGLDIVRADLQDASVFRPGFGPFDRVLCDVPCSGLGALRRRPEIRARGMARTRELPELQYKILENSSQYIRGGGLLVYSTCTLNPAENEAVAGRFLAGHTEFRPASSAALGGDWRATFIPRTEEDGDGFFIAVMRRRGDAA